MELILKDPILKFNPDTVENIRKIYNLNGPGRMNEAVTILGEWCKKQAHFVKKDFEVAYLENTLVACKGSIEKAKKQIDKLCTFKTLLPKFFIDCNPKEDLKSVTDLTWLLPLPKMTKDYCRVMLIKVNEKEFTEETFMEYYRLNIIMVEYLKRHDYANGIIILYDCRKLNLLEVMRKINGTELQQLMTILIEGLGARILGLHFLSESKTADLFIKFIKQFLSDKIGRRIYVHANMNNLHNIVDKEILPIEYGGTERSAHQLQNDWLEVLSSVEHVEYMKIMNKACTNEKYRQTNTFNDEYMGTPGTFRMLNID